MKRLLAGAFCLCLLLSGCNRSNPSPADPLHLELCPVTNSVTDSNGTEVLTLTYPEPKLTHCDETVAQRIMDDLKDRIDSYQSDGATLEEAARNAAADQENFIPWFAKLEGTVMRQDETVLSIFFTYSVYCGGNHSNTDTFSVTYDAENGKILQLTDILKNDRSVKELAVEVNRVLAPSANDLFDDYESLIGQQFASDSIDNWYLTETALCFHYAPYAISPYASGIITAEIPYAELEDFLTSNYWL
jgi:hypothetical protein